MRITVRTKPNARQARLVKIDETTYEAWVAEPAKDGKANEGLVRLLSDELGVPKSRIAIVRGHAARVKVVDVARE